MALAFAAFGRRTAASDFGSSKSKLFSAPRRCQQPPQAAAPVFSVSPSPSNENRAANGPPLNKK
jgi:hypothetical protein